uniref:Uncharacterized protein n=1 Tax=Globodera rostochiensis TaxID=31243 RepID=A0A914HD67_GLORO
MLSVLSAPVGIAQSSASFDVQLSGQVETMLGTLMSEDQGTPLLQAVPSSIQGKQRVLRSGQRDAAFSDSSHRTLKAQQTQNLIDLTLSTLLFKCPFFLFSKFVHGTISQTKQTNSVAFAHRNAFYYQTPK